MSRETIVYIRLTTSHCFPLQVLGHTSFRYWPLLFILSVFVLFTISYTYILIFSPTVTLSHPHPTSAETGSQHVPSDFPFCLCWFVTL